MHERPFENLDINIGVGIGHHHCKKFFLLKKMNIYGQYSPLWLVIDLNITLLQLLSLQLPIYALQGMHWLSRKKLFEFSEAFVYVFRTNSCSEKF